MARVRVQMHLHVRQLLLEHEAVGSSQQDVILPVGDQDRAGVMFASPAQSCGSEAKLVMAVSWASTPAPTRKCFLSSPLTLRSARRSHHIFPLARLVLDKKKRCRACNPRWAGRRALHRGWPQRPSRPGRPPPRIRDACRTERACSRPRDIPWRRSEPPCLPWRSRRDQPWAH